MKTALIIRRLCTITLISVLSMFAFTTQTDAQGSVLKQLNRSPNLQRNTGKNHKANPADGSAGFLQEVLYSFCSVVGRGNCLDGNMPETGLIRDTAGNLYGTTFGGGAYDGGTVFMVDTSGNETVLYNFCTAGESTGGCTDGWQPAADLFQDVAGNLYGTTSEGGTSAGVGAGTVFKLVPPAQLGGTWTETVLYNFCSEGGSNCTDGSRPIAGLIKDTAGNLYGTTQEGGANNRGTVFKLTPTTGQETVLYSFCSISSCTDGWSPFAGLLQDAAGNLYGTTSYGGANTYGTVFKLEPPAQQDGTWTETVLYSFCTAVGCIDGAFPYAGLISDTAGNLYGTTQEGGALTGGTVFMVDATGNETVLHSFCTDSESGCTDGWYPRAGLLQDASGTLYGTTFWGGANTYGTVFKLEPPAQQDGTWTETVLHSFCSVANCPDGAYPLADLIQDAAGNLYGTTFNGGNANGAGTVFELAVPNFKVAGSTVLVNPGATSGNTSTIT